MHAQKHTQHALARFQRERHPSGRSSCCALVIKKHIRLTCRKVTASRMVAEQQQLEATMNQAKIRRRRTQRGVSGVEVIEACSA